MIGARLSMVLALVVSALAGCQSARYVTKDADHGVIAIPSNAARFRRQAEKLMAGHFPEGFAVSEEEAAPPVSATAGAGSRRNRGEWRITYYRVGRPGPPDAVPAAPAVTADAGHAPSDGSRPF